MNIDITKNPLANFLSGRLKKSVLIWDKIYKREVAQKTSFYSVQPGEDDLYSFETMAKANSFAKIQAELLFYVQRGSSVFHSIDEEKYWLNRKKVVLCMEDVVKHLSVDDNVIQGQLNSYLCNRFFFKEYVLKPLRENVLRKYLASSVDELQDFMSDNRCQIEYLNFRYRLVWYMLRKRCYKLARIIAG